MKTMRQLTLKEFQAQLSEGLAAVGDPTKISPASFSQTKVMTLGEIQLHVETLEAEMAVQKAVVESLLQSVEGLTQAVRGFRKMVEDFYVDDRKRNRRAIRTG